MAARGKVRAFPKVAAVEVVKGKVGVSRARDPLRRYLGYWCEIAVGMKYRGNEDRVFQAIPSVDASRTRTMPIEAARAGTWQLALPDETCPAGCSWLRSSDFIL